MADVDINPFGEHESRTEEPTDENIPLTPVTPGRSTWEPEREQETSLYDSLSPRWFLAWCVYPFFSGLAALMSADIARNL